MDCVKSKAARRNEIRFTEYDSKPSVKREKKRRNFFINRICDDVIFIWIIFTLMKDYHSLIYMFHVSGGIGRISKIRALTFGYPESDEKWV